MAKEVQKLDIIFKEPTATFKAGENVCGIVQVEIALELRLKGVKLLLLGAARVHWDEKRAYTKGSSAKLSHRNLDSYLDETYIILGKGDVLAPGRYNWPFNIRLPLYLPASYDGQWGRVQYIAKVVLERPWKGDIDFSRNFNVLALLDLNTEPDAKKSVENISEAMVGTGCCKSGPVSGHLSLARRGFAVGQTIPFRATIDNKSTKKLNVRIVLSQHATFRADKQVRKNSTVVKVMTKGDMKGGQEMLWEDELKVVPNVPPTRLGGGCKTIDIKYLLTLIIEPSGSAKDVEVPVEVIIGTIALRRSEPLSSTSSTSSSSHTPQGGGQGGGNPSRAAGKNSSGRRDGRGDKEERGERGPRGERGEGPLRQTSAVIE